METSSRASRRLSILYIGFPAGALCEIRRDEDRLSILYIGFASSVHDFYVKILSFQYLYIGFHTSLFTRATPEKTLFQFFILDSRSLKTITKRAIDELTFNSLYWIPTETNTARGT